MKIPRLIPLGFLCLASVLQAAPTQVTVSGRQLLVEGQPYTVRGVDYSPIPPGSSVGAPSAGCVGGYTWWSSRSVYLSDFPLIKRMGANTVRAYGILNDTSGGTVAQVRQMLDDAHAQGLFVIMNYYPSHFDSVPANAAAWRAQFVSGINAYKDHPAVLLWEFGNEQNLDNGQHPAWYPLVNNAAGDAHAADTHHPVMTSEGECLPPNCTPPITMKIGDVSRSANDASMPNLDLWGLNLYRGPSFGNFFNLLASSTTKPVMVTEFGKDAYRDSAGQEDQAMQALYLNGQWTEIAANSSAADPTKILVGGVAFEWTDEWWKDGGGTTCNAHDSAVLFSRTNDATDPGYNDEWFGLTSVRPVDAITNPSGNARTLRSGYSTLQSFWNPTASPTVGQGSSLIEGTARNFPNPFRVGAQNTKFVVLLNAPASVDIRIYDAGAQFVASLSGSSSIAGRVELGWDGRNRQGDQVSPGLYIARIEAKSADREEQQFRRVVAVK